MKNLFWTRKGVGGSIKRDKGGRESFIKWDMMGRRMAQMGIWLVSKEIGS